MSNRKSEIPGSVSPQMTIYRKSLLGNGLIATVQPMPPNALSASTNRYKGWRCSLSALHGIEAIWCVGLSERSHNL
jgi:hypothetical protein